MANCYRCDRVPDEADLRVIDPDLDSPFPEEGNRQMIARLASLHLAPTPRARRDQRVRSDQRVRRRPGTVLADSTDARCTFD